MFSLQGEVNLSDDEEEVGGFSSESGDSNPAEHFNLAPFLFLGIQPMAKVQYQDIFTTTKQ
jgi:hypothetical protein